MGKSQRNDTKQTAKLAAEILVNNGTGFKRLTTAEKRNLLIAFAEKNKALYGQAYDVVRCPAWVDFSDLENLREGLKYVIVYEVKSTRKSSVKEDFSGYFFDLTTAELLVAQSLKEQYRFVFVNILTGKFMEMTIREIHARARTVYPKWAVQL